MIYIIFFHQLFFAIIALISSYLIGKSIVHFFTMKGHFFFRLFVTHIVGFSTLYLVYAIIMAHGRTVAIILLPIITYLIYHFRPAFIAKAPFEKEIFLKEIWWSIVPFLLVFLYQSWFYFDFVNGELKPLLCDFHRYAIFTQSIHLWGLESYLSEMNYFFPAFRTGIVPYHYPELWLTSLFSNLFHNSLVNSYYFIVYPLLTTTFIIGVMSLFEETIKNKILILIVAVVLCFITDITFSFYMDTPNSLSITGINGQKLAYVYCFLLLAFILFRQKEWFLGQMVLVIIPLFSTIYLPGIWGGLLLFNIGNYVFYRQTKGKTSLFIIAGILITLICYSIFLNVFQSPFTKDYAVKKILTSGIFSSFDGHLSLRNIKMIVSNFIHYAIPNIALHCFSRLLLYLPFFLLFGKSLWKQKQLVVLSLLFLICGAVLTSLSKILHDSNQFTHLLGSVFIVLIIICIADFTDSFKGAHWAKYSIVFCTVAFICLSWSSPYNSRALTDNSEDIRFVKQIAQRLTEKQNIVLVFYANEANSEGTFYNWIGQNTILNVSQSNSNTIMYIMANPEIFTSKNRENYIDDYFYTHFTPMNTWKAMNKTNTVEKFIEQYHIKNFYCKKGADIPEFVRKRVIETIQSASTKNRFIRIK